MVIPALDTPGTLEGLQRYTIHGSPYVRAFYTLPDDPDTVHRAQLPAEAFDDTLRPGDPITVTMLLRTVMAIARRPVLDG